MNYPLIRFLLLAIIISIGSFILAGQQRSNNYSFDYAATSMGGGVSSSENYSMVAYADESGSAETSESDTYSMAPAVGSPSPREAGAENWMLY